MRKSVLAMAAPVLVIAALSGCGSSSTSSSSSTTTASIGGAGAAIAAEVPAAIKSKGTLTVASDATYAPNEFIAPDGHTVIGMDVDLMKAIGAQMGLKVNFVNATFDTIIPGLAAGKYDLGVSSFTDTKEREKTVDFVDYYSAGISFYAKSSANPAVSTVEDLCGKSVAAEKGTVEQEQAEAQSKKCAKAGKQSVKVLTFPDQNGANLALSSGRAEVGMADSPIAEYQVKQSSGAFKLIGKPYEVAPYGLAVPKKSGLSKPILAALKAIIANGEYTKILAKWGLQSGAISSPKIDGATS
ncbi:MAG TPA: ABC transporter substrate-binding protein [Solirubrobacteraceae bacterium]|jgi:polar amino acid transport system substrate-binding protein|nr:ABC transporter substrate-binding protein [Solirubrobacteraceae bacterium]